MSMLVEAKWIMVSSVLIADSRMQWQTLTTGITAKPPAGTKRKTSIVPEVGVEIVVEEVVVEHQTTDIAENAEEAIAAIEMVNVATMATAGIVRTDTEVIAGNGEATVDVEVIVAAIGLVVTVVGPALTEVVCLPVIASSGVVAVVTVVELPHHAEEIAAILHVPTATTKAAINNETFLSHTKNQEEALFENEYF